MKPCCGNEDHSPKANKNKWVSNAVWLVIILGIIVAAIIKQP